MREWDRIVTDPELRFADAWRHVEDEGAAADLHLGRYRILATGGSTRERGIFVYAQFGEWRRTGPGRRSRSIPATEAAATASLLVEHHCSLRACLISCG